MSTTNALQTPLPAVEAPKAWLTPLELCVLGAIWGASFMFMRVAAPEFGATPLFTVDELRGADVDIVLYPLSAFRAMNKAAENVYEAIRRDGTQKNVVDTMQTRAELYERIDYHSYEQKLDALFAQNKSTQGDKK